MTTAQDETDTLYIATFLRSNLGLYYCNGCLHEELNVGSRRAFGITRMLLTIANRYDEGTECDCCGRTKKSIAFLPRIYHLGPLGFAKT